jgi:signal peptidase II
MKIFLATVLVAFFASLLSALLADAYLTERIAIFGSFAGFQLSHNRGVAFGVAIPEPWQSIFIAAALLLLLRMALHEARDTPKAIGFGLILGGALGNIADRLGDGLVTDYVQVGSFPIFNAADSFVTIGVALLLLHPLIEYMRMQALRCD